MRPRPGNNVCFPIICPPCSRLEPQVIFEFSHLITWTSAGTVGSSVKIELLKAGTVVRTLSADTPNEGSFSWTVPASLASGTDYRIRITSTTTTTITDMSTTYFTITPMTSTPTIRVTGPDGGESWLRDSTHPITWDYTGSPGTVVKIMLLKAGTEVGTIRDSVSVDSSGKVSYTWLIPPSTRTGSDFRVGVQSISQPATRDTSTSYFSIIKSAGKISSLKK